MDFNDRQYYLNRECTWLSFNQRVLRESTSKDNPLLERLRFIAISCSNLDEFFMIRVAGLKHLIESGVKHHDISGLTPQGQMDAVSRIAHEQMHDIDRCLKATLAELKEHGIRFVRPEDLDAQQDRWLTEFFEREIFPVVTPMGIDPSHPFPFLTSKSLNLAVHLKRPEDKEIRLAILPVPVSVLGRLIKVPELQHYLYLEDILSYFAERFFTGYEILETTPFRITRDADLDIREDVDDLLLEVEKSLEKRRKGAAVRLDRLGRRAVHDPARIGETERAMASVEEGGAELPLERRDPLAQRRLRDAKLACRLGEAQTAGKLDELTILLNAHAAFPLDPMGSRSARGSPAVAHAGRIRLILMPRSRPQLDAVSEAPIIQNQMEWTNDEPS